VAHCSRTREITNRVRVGANEFTRKMRNVQYLIADDLVAVDLVSFDETIVKETETIMELVKWDWGLACEVAILAHARVKKTSQPDVIHVFERWNIAAHALFR
jgi:hypothetical protein